MKLFLFIYLIIIPFFPGKPIENARISIEETNRREIVAFQKTGIQGEAAFKHLDAGEYRLIIEFPQQEGKWIKTKRKFNTLTKASYNPDNKTYYYQGEEGFFSVKLKNIRRIDNESIQPIFREIRREEGRQIGISQFRTRKRGAQITIKVKALTASQFKRLTDKKGSITSTISIPGAR